MKLSIVIPSLNDHLQKTINDLLKNSELPPGELEIVAVLNGYWPTTPIEDHPYVKLVHLGENVGMREGINTGVRVAQGEYLMRSDAHCSFAPGYDRVLLERIKDNWIVYPKRFDLDPEKWEVMPGEPSVYNKLVIDQDRSKFAGVNWKSREKGRENKEIDESMAMQGSAWIMKRSWWDDVIGELDNRYGTLYGDSHEMVFKTWKAGGKLMVNKNTWHSHKHRDFPRGHNYGSEQAIPGWKQMIDDWGDYYEKEVRPKWGI